jgi:F-type H+/Na+-transporting ATPase subunit alpha
VAELRYTEVGYVKSIRGCIVIVEGLNSCINGQLINFGFGTQGIILGFDEKEAQVLIVKQSMEIRTGDEARASLEPFNVPVGKNFIGRIVTPLCEPFDSLGPIQEDEYAPIFPTAPAILERQPLCKTLETGTKVLDTMIPIGLGQRQLVLGNKKTQVSSVFFALLVKPVHRLPELYSYFKIMTPLSILSLWRPRHPVLRDNSI